MKKADAEPGLGTKSEPYCRCEATIPNSILEGYACGKPECWRTPVVKASFDAFMADLIRARGEAAPPEPATPKDH